MKHNLYLVFQYPYSSIKQKMMENNNKRKMKIKDGHNPIELTTITLDKEERNDQRQVKSKDADIQTEKIIGKDVGIQAEQTGITLNDQQTNDRRQVEGKDAHVQTELTAIMLDGEKTNLRRRVVSKDAENKNNSPNMFDNLRVDSDREEALDLTVVMKDFGNAPNISPRKYSQIVEVINEELNLRTTNIMNDIRNDLGPIVGYADEPLLPLSKACSPLKKILYNLPFYIHMVLEETPEQPLDGLTIDESAAIRLYTMEWEKPHRSLYSMLNHTLKYEDREYLRPYFKYLKLFLTALAKLPCVPQETVWRGVTKDLSAELPPGTPVTWWAFSSCTTQLPVLESNMYLGSIGNRTLFSVEAINGRTICAHSQFVTEHEILLLPGTHMIVQSQFSPASGLHVIHLKQVRPEQMLLEPPFEGNLNIFNNLF